MIASLLWGDLSWLPGIELVLAGTGMFVLGAMGRTGERSEAARLVSRLRRLIWGGVLVALGAGIWLHEPVLVAAALVVGFEETLETGIVLYALRRDPGA